MTKSVVLADPRGFCAGVDRAILTVQTILKAAEASGKRTREDGLPPVYAVSYTHLSAASRIMRKASIDSGVVRSDST